MELVNNGYSCTAGQLDNGWFAAVNIIEDRDREFTRDSTQPGLDRKVELLPGQSCEEWEAACVSQTRRLIYLEKKAASEQSRRETLAEADRILEPVAAKGVLSFPLLAWSQKNGEQWSLNIREKNEIKAVFKNSVMPRYPAVAWHGDHVFAAVEINDIGFSRILVFPQAGEQLEIAGRRPVLCSAQDRLFLLYEILEGSIPVNQLYLAELAEDKIRNQWRIGTDFYNMNADIDYSYKEQALYICFETAPVLDKGWHRDLNIWRMKKGGVPEPAPGTRQGRLAIKQAGFLDKQRDVNMPPVNPRIKILRDQPILTFRRFRYRGFRCFGWDVFLAELKNDSWSEPHRVSENVGPEDADYRVIEEKDELVGLFPCCDNQADSTRAYNFRVEIAKIRQLPECAVPADMNGQYKIPVSIYGAGEDPAKISDKPGELKLIWGDLHQHTCQSKCMSSIDGSPDDVVRFSRDMLGCQVLTFTDHLQQMSAAEAAWSMDQLEEAAGDDGIVLYGCEPGVSPGRDTNFYTIDREIFERLRLLVLTYQDRSTLYHEIKKRLPQGAVIALQHFHGGADDTWDPDLEVAMEAMQCRGNVMLDRQSQDNPLFPNNFLNAGAEIGLVGGTDHTSAGLVNPFCLTGFWVRELTPGAVWEAILKRRTIACSNGKIAVWPELSGNPMGTEMSAVDKLEVKTSVIAPRTIRRVCLLKDGTPMEWREVEAKQAIVTLRDVNPEPGRRHWYVVTVEGESVFSEDRNQPGSGPRVVAHSSPFFVDGTL